LYVDFRANSPVQSGHGKPISTEELAAQSESSLSGELTGYMPTPIFEAFEESLHNRPEGISPYTVWGYVADLKRNAPPIARRAYIPPPAVDCSKEWQHTQ